MTGPPMHINMDFIASGLVQTVVGLGCAAVLFGYTWWAPLLLGGAWLSTHWFLRESAVWMDRNTPEVRAAQRDAEYAYRLAVDPPAAKELRLFGLADWVMERFVARRTRLHDLQYEATRLREKPLRPGACWSCSGPTSSCSGRSLPRRLAGRLDLGQVVVFAQVAVGVSAVAFGGLSWALDGAAAPVAAVLRLQSAMAERGALAASASRAAAGLRPARRARSASASVVFAYPGSDRPVLDGFDLTVPAGSSLAIVGQNGAGKTTLAKLLCRLYDPQGGAIEVDGVDLRDLDVDAWRSRLAAVFQDFIRFELPLRDNVAPGGAPDHEIVRGPGGGGRFRTWRELDTPLARGYDGGTELSGGQWQRVALARALCAVRLGAGLVLLDEPTAQLDVRGRGGDLRPHPGRHPEGHDHPDLPPLLDRAPRRPHLRAGARPGGRARHPRRAHGPGGPLPHDVRPAGPALRRRRRTRKERPMSASPDRLPPALSSMWRVLKLGYRHEPRHAAGRVRAVAVGRAARRAPRPVAEAPGRRRAAGRPAAWSWPVPWAWGRPPPPPGSWSRSAPACSGASATRSRSRWSRTWPGCRPRSRPSPTRSGPSTSTGCRSCATRSSCSITCTCRSSPPAAGSCAWGSRSGS